MLDNICGYSHELNQTRRRCAVISRCIQLAKKELLIFRPRQTHPSQTNHCRPSRSAERLPRSHRLSFAFRDRHSKSEASCCSAYHFRTDVELFPINSAGLHQLIFARASNSARVTTLPRIVIASRKGPCSVSGRSGHFRRYRASKNAGGLSSRTR